MPSRAKREWSLHGRWSRVWAAWREAGRVNRNLNRAKPGRGAAWFDALERRVLLSAAFDLIGLTDLRADADFAGIDGGGVSVAVIDTGVDFTHFRLSPNFVAGADLVFGGDEATPVHEHGTHVAGIVGATDPEIGVATGVGLIGLQVFTPVPGQSPTASNRHIEDALQWVIDNRAQHNIVAVNMSLGGGFFASPAQAGTPIYLDEIQTLEALGVTVVSAAGNSYGILQDPSSGQTFNAMFPNSGAPGIVSTLNVGAVWETNEGGDFIVGNTVENTTDADRITGFSQRPPTNAANGIFAPGAFINSTIPGNRFAELPGTSMASPMVAGAVALMQDAALTFGGRLLSTAEVQDIIINTADLIFDGDDEDSVAFVDTNGDGVISNNELRPFEATDLVYPRLNVHEAVKEIERRFADIAAPDPGLPGTGDPNSTIEGAILGPRLDGAPTGVVLGSIGFDQQADIGPTDVDLYRVQMLSPGTLTVTTDTHPTDPDDFDTILRLFDSNGVELTVNDDIQPGVETFSQISTDLAPGTYFVGVSGFNNDQYNPNQAGGGVAGATGNYSLLFSLTNPDPNGLLTGAVPVNLGGGGEPEFFNGFIGADFGEPVGVADVDLFRLVVPDDGTLLIDIDTPFVEGEFVDSFLRVFDSAGNELAFSDDELSVDIDGFATEFTDPLFGDLAFHDPVDRQFFDGHQTDSFIAGTVTRGDVFYIGVSDFLNNLYDPTNLDNRPATGDGGFYNLIISFFNNDLNGSIPQAVDGNAIGLPIIDQPGEIGTDGSNQGLQQVGDRDVDFVKVTPANDGVLEIDIDSYSVFDAADAVDTVVYLYDSDGVLVGGNDDADGLDPLLLAEVEGGRDYFVAIVGFGNDNFDPFQLGSGTPGDTGLYEFNAELLPIATVNARADDGISFGGVTTINAGDTLSAFIGSDNGLVRGATDIDLFRFDASENAEVEVRTALVSDFSADTFLRVFDAAGNEMASNDNANSTTVASRVTFEAQPGQTYFIGVNGASPNAGDYDANTGANAAPGAQGDYAVILNADTIERPEIDVRGNGLSIADGDPSPDPADGTDFGSVELGGTPVTHTFVVHNVGDADLQLTGNPLVTIGGVAAGDFVVTQPAGATVAPDSSVSFDVTFTPTALGSRSASVTIANDDSDESGYTFWILGVGVEAPAPEIDITGLGLSIADGDTTPQTLDNTDFGDALVAGGVVTHAFTVTNLGDATLNLTGQPIVQVTGVDAGDFAVTVQPVSDTVAPGVANSVDFQIAFDPSAGGERRATVTVLSDDADESPYTFDIIGFGVDRIAVGAFGQSIGVTRLQQTDGFGNVFDFSLNGDGEATLFEHTDGHLSIELTGTTDRSRLTVRPDRNAVNPALHSIVADGALASINARDVRFVGDILIAGWVGSMVTGDIDAQHRVEIGGTTGDRGVNLTFGVLTDVNFVSTAIVQRLTATRIENVDPAHESFIAPKFGTVQVKGDRDVEGVLEADLIATGIGVDGRVLDNLRVAGPASGVTFDLDGDAGNVKIDGDTTDTQWLVDGAASNLTFGGDVSMSTIALDGGANRLSAGQLDTVDMTGGDFGTLQFNSITEVTFDIASARSLLVRRDARSGDPGDVTRVGLNVRGSNDPRVRDALGQFRADGDTDTLAATVSGSAGTFDLRGAVDGLDADIAGPLRTARIGDVGSGDLSAGSTGTVQAVKWMTGEVVLLDVRTLRIAGDRRSNTRGDMGANVTVNADGTSEARSVVTNAQVAHTLTGRWRVIGPVGNVRAGVIDAGFDGLFEGEVKTLASAAQFDGLAAAIAFGRVDVRGDMNGATLIAGGPTGPGEGNSIGTFRVGGAVTGGTVVLVGVDGFDVGDPLKSGAVHFIKNITISGAAPGGAVAFTAGQFPRSVSIDRVRIDPLNDGEGRFVLI